MRYFCRARGKGAVPGGEGMGRMGFLVTMMKSNPLRWLGLVGAALLMLAGPPAPATAAGASGTPPEVTINHGVLDSLGPLRRGPRRIVLRPPRESRATEHHKSKREASRHHARSGHRTARARPTHRREHVAAKRRVRAAETVPPPKPEAASSEPAPMRAAAPSEVLPPALPPAPVTVGRLDTSPATPAKTLVPGGAADVVPPPSSVATASVPSSEASPPDALPGLEPAPSIIANEPPAAATEPPVANEPPAATGTGTGTGTGKMAAVAPPPPVAAPVKKHEAVPAAISSAPVHAMPRAVAPLHVDFSPGSVDLSASAKQELDSVAKSLGNDDGQRVQLVAYATAGQGDDTNGARRLSLTRALNVRAYLIDRGVRNTRMDVRALGNRPDGATVADRVDIVFVSK
jgi:outer membrane protein OmpA-like peptidoglycan-associated protein